MDPGHPPFSCAALGDVDGDGVPDVAIGAPYDDDDAAGAGDINNGAVYIMFMNRDGSIKGYATNA